MVCHELFDEPGSFDRFWRPGCFEQWPDYVRHRLDDLSQWKRDAIRAGEATFMRLVAKWTPDVERTASKIREAKLPRVIVSVGQNPQVVIDGTAHALPTKMAEFLQSLVDAKG